MTWTTLYMGKRLQLYLRPPEGATPEMVELMDGWMENYAKITEEYFADSKPNWENLIMIQTTQAAEQPEALALPSVLSSWKTGTRYKALSWKKSA